MCIQLSIHILFKEKKTLQVIIQLKNAHLIIEMNENKTKKIYKHI